MSRELYPCLAACAVAYAGYRLGNMGMVGGAALAMGIMVAVKMADIVVEALS